ncbi:hypothetical protein EN816_00735 [Mesorhizobium sp. M8A.F.Ca.ET.173.01.1.1]|nr:hypothetical protein EN816_00735 [Mesorhizobium sp. M8A.F.Ca.ET.173.01.1.1]
MSEASQDYSLSAKRLSQLRVVDAMPAQIRACVHEFGLPIVTVLTRHGVKDPRHIREIVKEIWSGARQDGQRGGVRNTLDVLLAQGPISSAALTRLFNESSLTIVSMEPTRAMLDASMAEVSGFNERMTKEEKHRRRLRAALRASMQRTDTQ